MRVVFIFFLCVMALAGMGQEEQPLSISFQAKTGVLMPHRETMHHLVKDRNNVFAAEFSTQDNTDSVWSKLFRYPSKGTTIAFQDYGNREVLGVSVSFFRFNTFPIYQSERWGFVDFQIGNGLSYITKKYEPFTNKKNIAIGSHINGYVNFQFSWTKPIRNFHVGAGINFAHISNAALKTPNQGLNTLTGLINIGYDITPREVYKGGKFIPDSLSQVRRFSPWQFHFIFGLKQNLPDHLQARNFGVAAFQGLYRKNISTIWDFETGIDLVYNEANRWYFEISPVPIYEALLIGGYAGMAMSMYRSQIYFGLGVYGLNLINPAGWVYNRIGLRYNTNDHWNISVGIKAHVGRADYLEWGLGYRL